MRGSYDPVQPPSYRDPESGLEVASDPMKRMKERLDRRVPRARARGSRDNDKLLAEALRGHCGD